jgi:hypothetical protein
MPFVSKLYTGEKIIGETDPTPHTPAGMSTGYSGRDYKKYPVGYSAAAKPFSLKKIPRSEWDDRIAEMEKNKARLSDLLLAQNIPSLDQNGTNYCWFNGVVTGVYCVRARMNLPYKPLSPASGAAQIKGFRNQGGWGGDALEWMVENGACEQRLWPQAAIDRQYLTEESKQNAKLYRITETNVDVEEDDFDAMMTLLFNGIPCPLGLDWWSHLVCAVDPVKTGSGRYGVRFRNSWGDSYGSKGFSILEENKARGDVSAPRLALA